MISKHKTQFEGLSDKVWNSLDKKLQNDLSKYRRVRRDVIKFEKEIESFRSKIKDKQNKVRQYNKILNHLYGKINHLKSDYIPIVNVVSYVKSNKVYYNINVKFKNNIKSMYVGNYEKLSLIFKDKLGLNRRPNKTKTKELVEFYFVDEIIDICIENKDTFFDMKIDKSELYNKI
jgi:hypothetical protein